MRQGFRFVHLGVAAGLAAAAVTGVATLRSGAAGSAASSFVPITPCRLMDTRPAPENVGARNGAIAAGESYDAIVWGTNGNCTIPSTATAVSMNVTAIAPTAASFLTVYPSDAARPLAASLNWVAGQAPTPNAVTTTLSPTGRVSFYNLSGTVHLTADIVGYYEPSTAGPAGPAGPAGAVGATGNQGLAGNRENRLTRAQIAGLQWWQDPGRPLVLTGLATRPYAVASDGTSIWVTDATANRVRRLDPVTGAALATVNVGAAPSAVEFDGRYIWVVNNAGNSVSKIDPALAVPAVIATIPVGSAPLDAVSDGSAIWVTNYSSNTVSRIDLATNVVSTVSGLDKPYGITFDGSKVWVVNNSTTAQTSLQSITTTVPFTTGTPIHIDGANSDAEYAAFDGTYVWVTMRAANELYRVTITGTTSAMEVTGIGNDPVGITYDGTYLWVTSHGDGTVLRVIPSAPFATPVAFHTGPSTSQPSGITFDGRNLWVAAADTGTIWKVVPF